jgi:very-long-chain enoyl-CoA reductase
LTANAFSWYLAISLRPRVHNVISYSLALLVFVVVAALRLSSFESAAPLAALVGGAMWVLHFLRRTLESAWLHRYSKPRVPLSDVIIEYAYYWGFAAWAAAVLFSKDYAAPDSLFVLLGGAVFLLGEAGNAKAHRMLQALRPAGSSARQIPRGFLFNQVSCPHYFFEILSWLGFAVATQSLPSLVFLLLGAAILGGWAHGRHKAYRAEFNGKDGQALYPATRRALLPGIF